MEYIGLAILWVGVFFCLTGLLGMVRFPDVFTRIHAAGKVATLGLAFITIGTAFIMPDIIPRAVLLVGFMILTSPVASTSIASAAHRNLEKSVGKRDDLETYNEEQKTNKASSTKPEATEKPV